MAGGPHTPAGGSRRAVSGRPARGRAPQRSARDGAARRRPGTRRPPVGGQRSDLNARLLAAVPAIAVALFIVIEGGLVFALGLFALGCICLHELYAMYDRAHPVRLAGFIALAGLLAAALYGGPFQILLVGTFLGDAGAYLGGRMFGQRPLAPRISPNKTVEGLLIGMVCAILGVWFAGRYQGWLPGTHALVLGLGVAIVAPIGDLFESFVKREAGAKDTGRVFGAHGGALDRLDAVLFAAVVGYYIWAAYT